MALVLQSVHGVVEEITRIHKSLPPRPALDDVDAALGLIRNVEKEEQLRIDAIMKQRTGSNIPDELFFVLLEMQKNLVYFQSKEQRREALKLLDLENVHALYDEFIQRASKCIPSSEEYNAAAASNSNGSVSTVSEIASSSAAATSSTPDSKSLTVSSGPIIGRETLRSPQLFSKDDSYLKKAKTTMHDDRIGAAADSLRRISTGSSIKSAVNSGEDGEKLALIKLASLIEISAKKGTRDLDLHNMLADQIEWLPDSLGKLFGLMTLILSENQIVALPKSIGGLSSLRKLDLRSNRISELPDSIGNLFSLVFLDLSGNQLSALPATFGKLSHLAELDLSSNQLLSLSDAIGNLVNLKKLIIETNDIEELPHTIGNCSSLVELRADYNHLKALPEAIGRLESLEVLSMRYNNIKGLPTTMASMSKLKELDISFNELESVPESLCLATTIVKMNLGNNFADLQSLPRSIGNLEMLEVLDISNNQIRVLPDSFSMLSNLQVLRIQGNPWEVPPRHVAEMGAQAVVNYVAELVAKRDIKAQPARLKKTWAQFCFCSRPNKRKHDSLDYVRA